MNKVPLVSIVLPVYNAAPFLNPALESILGQTFRDFELIIINDGSIDYSEEIIQTYTDKRIRYYSQKNIGVSATLNKAIEFASGKYIWRHDADDICLPDQLERQLDFLEKHSNYALVSTQIAFMTNNGKIAFDFKQPKDTYFNNKTFIQVERNHFNPYSPITHATVLLKKEVFDLVGGYRPEFLTSEDTDLWLRILEHYNAAVLHYCSYFVRMNATSATQTYKQSTSFYRDLAYKFADERAIRGTDTLQRGEPMPKPPNTGIQPVWIKNKGKGLVFRNDLLDFNYRVQLNARDYKNILRTIRLALVDGWLLSRTWKAILFPLLGSKVVNTGVSLKKIFKL